MTCWGKYTLILYDNVLFFSAKNKTTNKYLFLFTFIYFASNVSYGWIYKVLSGRSCKPWLSQQPGAVETAAFLACRWLGQTCQLAEVTGSFHPSFSGYRYYSVSFIPFQFYGFHVNLNSLKYYSHSPWAARYKNKDVSKQPPNPTGQVRRILKEKNTHFAVGQAKSISHALNEIYKDWHTWCAHTINLHTHAHTYTAPPALLLYTVKSCII